LPRNHWNLGELWLMQAVYGDRLVGVSLMKAQISLTDI